MAAKANEIEIVRVYDAPVALVWDAWTDVEKVAKWWGPRGFTITTKSKDFRPGGKWIYTMHGPDGTDYPNITTYHEIIEHRKMVYDHGGNEERPKLFTVTVFFAEEMGKTIMTMTMALDTPEAAQEIRKFIKQAGGNSTWDRLGEFLEFKKNGNDPFIINRTFEAPIERVFELWSTPEHIAKWQPPSGFKMEYISADIRSGGNAHYCVYNSENKNFVKAKYHEVRPHDLITWSQQFVDENGEINRHHSAPLWPATMHTKVCFAKEDNNNTRVTLTWVGEGSKEEIEAFVKEKAGMTMGWNASFDKLDELL